MHSNMHNKQVTHDIGSGAQLSVTKTTCERGNRCQPAPKMCKTSRFPDQLLWWDAIRRIASEIHLYFWIRKLCFSLSLLMKIYCIFFFKAKGEEVHF